MTTERTRDWDPFDPEAAADPRAEYARLRNRCPVPYTDRFGGFWTLTRYEDVRSAALDHTHFPSCDRVLAHIPEAAHFVPVVLNPPEHTPYRRALLPYFAPERMRALEPKIRSQVVELLEPLVAAGQADFARDFAAVLPIQVLCDLLNLPDESWIRMRDVGKRLREAQAHNWSNAEGESSDGSADSELEIARQFEMVLGEEVARLIELRKREPLDPKEDLISGLLADDEIPDDVILNIGGTLIAAGFDTTKSAIGAAICYLAGHPDDQEVLRREPERIVTAVEELLRWRPPMDNFTRRAANGATVDGRTIPDGDLVALSWAAANLDPTHFENPNEVDIGRTPNRHLTFGYGIHRCAGAPMARLELRVTLEELLARTSGFLLAGKVVEKPLAFFEGGYESIPISLIG